MVAGEVQRSRNANRYVSQRLRELRLARGMNQTEAGKLIAQHLAGTWRVQVVSRAERCGEGPEIKRWNVDDLYGLAAAFGVPVSYFLERVDEVPTT